MNESNLFILSLSIIFALIIGIVRFRIIDKDYYPFIYYTGVALLVEVAIHILMRNELYKTRNALINVYSFIEFSLLTWLFHCWGLFNRRKRAFFAIIGIAFLIWLGSTVFTRGFYKVNLYFLILYSFALIFFSVSTFNKEIVRLRASIFTNAKFWICLGIIIFYTFFILTCTANLTIYWNGAGEGFKRELQDITVYTNLFVNLIYALAAIWIPRKKTYINPF